MKSNASNSTTIEMKVPLMMAGDFEPHFSVKNMLKDVRIGAKLARDFALDLPVTEICRDMLLNELKQGRGDADYASIAQKYFPASAKIAKPTRKRRPNENGRDWPVSRRDQTRGASARPRADQAAETKSAKTPRLNQRRLRRRRNPGRNSRVARLAVTKRRRAGSRCLFLICPIE